MSQNHKSMHWAPKSNVDKTLSLSKSSIHRLIRVQKAHKAGPTAACIFGNSAVKKIKNVSYIIHQYLFTPLFLYYIYLYLKNIYIYIHAHTYTYTHFSHKIQYYFSTLLRWTFLFLFFFKERGQGVDELEVRE